MPIPLIPLITAGISAYSALRSSKKAKDTENELEVSLNNAPKYKPNSSILSYYNEALRRYNTNPSDTREYKVASQNIKQGTVQGLKYLQDRRSGLAGTPTLIANQNNSLLKAAVNAENRKAQEFSVLANATGMKAGEDRAAFQQNEMYPFEAKYNLLQMKAAAQRANQRQNTSNLYTNLGAAGSIMAGGDGEGWGSGRDWMGRETRSFAGKNFTKPQWNKTNNAWSKSLSQQRFW